MPLPFVSASYLAVPHSSLSPSSLLFGYSAIAPSCRLFACFSPREVSVSSSATETEGGGVNGSDRLQKKQTLGSDLRRIRPSVGLTSFSKTLISSARCRILLDLLPHTHTLSLSLQTTPTMYLTVHYCVELASHDKICFIFMMLLV